MDLSALASDEITHHLYELRRQERSLLVELLGYLGEVDRRRLYLDMAFPSLFAFATDYLGYSKAAAFRRTTAARLLARYPIIEGYLADGRLNLTTLVELRDVLCDQRIEEILARAAGRTEEEVKILVAALAPRPSPPDLFRRLPVPYAEGRAGSSSGPEPLMSGSCPAPAEPPAGHPAQDRAAQGRLIPVSEELRVLRITVSADFARDLATVRSALSHQFPDGRLADVIHECIRVTLAACAQRRRGARAPRGSTAEPLTRQRTERAASTSRASPAAVRDAVWRRDEGRCAFVSADGHRCDSTHQLEFHHVVPFARGGPATIESISLRCRAHHLHEARRDFGDGHMSRAIEGSRSSRAGDAAGEV